MLGSYLRLFTAHYDFELWYWLEISKDIEARRATHPSGRCFQFLLPNRFQLRSARAPLVLFSGSMLSFPFSSLEVVPAKGFQDHLGWEPTPGNPLEWRRGDSVVAKYERYHGPLDYIRGQVNMRQPTLSRWVANAGELSDLEYSPQFDFKPSPHRF